MQHTKHSDTQSLATRDDGARDLAERAQRFRCEPANADCAEALPTALEPDG